jgi:hypothetical protein
MELGSQILHLLPALHLAVLLFPDLLLLEALLCLELAVLFPLHALNAGHTTLPKGLTEGSARLEHLKPHLEDALVDGGVLVRVPCPATQCFNKARHCCLRIESGTEP